MFYILRRRGLGLGSTKAIKELSQHEITIIRNDKLPEFKLKDVILRWGCVSTIPADPDITITLNKSAAISVVNNKSFFRKVLQKNIPEIIPKTWFNSDNPNITYPFILRPQTHAQGKHLLLCKDSNALHVFTQFNTKYINY